MTSKSKRSHRKDCVKLEDDLRVKMRDEYTQTDQLLPGKSYLYQFFVYHNSTNLELKKVYDTNCSCSWLLPASYFKMPNIFLSFEEASFLNKKTSQKSIK